MASLIANVIKASCPRAAQKAGQKAGHMGAPLPYEVSKGKESP